MGNSNKEREDLIAIYEAGQKFAQMHSLNFDFLTHPKEQLNLY
jgi:hypothetical protein